MNKLIFLEYLLFCGLYDRGPYVNQCQASSLAWNGYAVGTAESLNADIIKAKFPDVVAAKSIDEYTKYATGDLKKASPFAPKFLEYEPDPAELKAKTEEANKAKVKFDPNSLLSFDEHVARLCVMLNACHRSFEGTSGGPEVSGNKLEQLLHISNIALAAGGEGRIVGRNYICDQDGADLAKGVATEMSKDVYRRELPVHVQEFFK